VTPEQAKALAELSVLGYTDLTYKNMFFTTDGKIAIVDTEPVKRIIKKLFFLNPISVFLNDKDALLTAQSIAGIIKLKTVCSTLDAKQEVEKVEKNAAMWTLAKLVCKIAIACLALYFIPAAVIPVSGLLATCIKVCLVLKTINLTVRLLDISFLCHLSYRSNFIERLRLLDTMEAMGLS